MCLALITACASGGFGISTGGGFYMNSNEETVSDPAGITWRWDRTIYNNDTRTAPSGNEKYTLELLPDGRVSIRADCNLGGGNYDLNGSRISIEITHTTMAACPEGSLEKPYIRDLNSAAVFFIKGESLYLDLKYDTGTMHFSK